MKISFLQETNKANSDKVFNQLNSSENDFALENISEEEYPFYSKMINENNTNNEIIPNKSVKQNLDIAFNKKNKTKRILKYKPLLNLAASLILGILIFSAYQFNSNRKAADEAYYNEMTDVLLNLGRLEDQDFRINTSYYVDEENLGNNAEIIYFD